MKQRLILITASLLISILTLGSGCAKAAEIDVQIPTSRAVYQRNNRNRADIFVRVKNEEGASISASMQAADGKSLSEDVSLAPTAEDASVYEGAIPNIPAGGWYSLKITATDPQGTAATEVIEKIGVGEVFITGGQSNSCSFGWEQTSAEEDMVSAFDPQTDTWQHCDDPQPCISGFSAGNGNGSPWPTAGDELYAELQVPIGFITTGFGGSSIAELARTSAEAKEEEPDKANPAGHYDAILDAITTMKVYGYRAFLLHQGENDAGNTSTEVYAATLTKLIERTREDAGFDLPWMVANAAYTYYTNSSQEAMILEAQQSVCDEETIFLGPYTDDMTKATGQRGDDDLHFNLDGLIEHGRRWAEKIVEKLIPDYSQLPPETLAPSAPPTADPPQPSARPAESSQPAAAAPMGSASAQPNAPSTTNAPLPPANPQPAKKTASYKGKVFTSGIFKYKITADSISGRRVKITDVRQKNKKSVTIPKKVKYKNISYEVGAIDKKALKKFTKLKKIKTPKALYKTCKAQFKGRKITIKKY